MDNFSFYASTYFAFGKNADGTITSFTKLTQVDVEAIYRLML